MASPRGGSARDLERLPEVLVERPSRPRDIAVDATGAWGEPTRAAHHHVVDLDHPGRKTARARGTARRRRRRCSGRRHGGRPASRRRWGRGPWGRLGGPARAWRVVSGPMPALPPDDHDRLTGQPGRALREGGTDPVLEGAVVGGPTRRCFQGTRRTRATVREDANLVLPRITPEPVPLPGLRPMPFGRDLEAFRERLASETVREGTTHARTLAPRRRRGRGWASGRGAGQGGARVGAAPTGPVQSAGILDRRPRLRPRPATCGGARNRSGAGRWVAPAAHLADRVLPVAERIHRPDLGLTRRRQR